MAYKLSILFSFYFCFISVGQSVYKHKVIDQDTGTPLPNASIIFTQTNDTLTSNALGFFNINSSGTYLIKKQGYQDKRIELKKTEPAIIQLQINPSALNEVIITASQIDKKLKQSYATTEIISTKDIQRGDDTNLSTVLNRIPGIFMQSGTLNTNRITIRGIGSRNLYGTSKIRAYFQDIPLTTGNGETSIEDFELSAIARLEIIKGANAIIHGAGLGGSIHLIPKNATSKQSNINNTTTFGSFGLIKNAFNVSHGSYKNSINAIYSMTHSDGYRQNNGYDRHTLTINTTHYFNDKNEISCLGSVVDLKAYIPSSINKFTLNNSPKAAASTWARSKGHEDAQIGIFGVSWNHRYNSYLSHKTSVFSSFKNSYEPRPFNILSEGLSAYGIRSRLMGSAQTLSWTLGGEFFNDYYIPRTFENLYEDYPEGTGSIKGNKLSDLKEKRTYYNIFFEANYNIADNTLLAFGLNFNKTFYDVTDRFNNNSTLDQSGRYKFKEIASPTLGISYSASKNLNFYSNISHGFSPPTTTETLLPSGLINPDIKPETGWNYEMGMRSTFFNNRLQWNTALYSLNIRNLLVARRTGDDEFIGINAGKTQHNGIEMTMNYQWVNGKNHNINTFANYTLNSFKFKEFIDGDNNYSGNDLTGVPKDVFNAGIDFNSAFGLYGHLNFQYVGSMPITDSNSLYTNDYSLTNLKLGWLKKFNKKLNFDVFIGINNIFDKAHASQVLINASGFNGSQPRYYYPGYPINFYSGFHLKYQIN